MVSKMTLCIIIKCCKSAQIGTNIDSLHFERELVADCQQLEDLIQRQSHLINIKAGF